LSGDAPKEKRGQVRKEPERKKTINILLSLFMGGRRREKEGGEKSVASLSCGLKGRGREKEHCLSPRKGGNEKKNFP